MSASGWGYWVPYQEDVREALQKLRLDVFDRGDYQRPTIDLNGLDESNLLYADSEEQEQIMEDYGLKPLRPFLKQVGTAGLRDRLTALHNAPQLSSLEELEALQCLSDSGTRSVLDISRVTAEPEEWAIAPLPSDELIAIFGTARPTHSIIEEAEDQGRLDTGPRWQGLYVIVYKEEASSEIYITGSSGD